jgi:CNT family concentrative nucleoside transporter
MSMSRFMGLIGVFLFIGLAWGFSRDRRAIHWPTVMWALGLQWALGLVVLKGDALAAALGFLPFPPMAGWLALGLAALPFLRRFSVRRRPLPSGLRGRPGARLDRALLLAALVVALRGNLVAAGIQAARQGANNLMAFAAAGAGFVFGPLAAPSGAPVLGPGGVPVGSLGMVFAFVVLPTIVFVASLFAILYHLGVMQRVIGGFARALTRVPHQSH